MNIKHLKIFLIFYSFLIRFGSEPNFYTLRNFTLGRNRTEMILTRFDHFAQPLIIESDL